MNSRNQFAKQAVLFVVITVVVSAFVGCGRIAKPHTPARQGWKAEEFFGDASTVELCQAIEAGDYNDVVRQLDSGAKANALGKWDVSPALWAFLSEQPAIFELLLSHGADPNVQFSEKVTGISAFFREGESITYLAAKAPPKQYFDAVMQHGGDPNLVSNWMNESVLHAVVSGGATLEEKQRRISVLVAKGAKLNVVDGHGATPAMRAISWGGQYELALALLKAGTNPKIRTINNLSIVHLCLSDRQGLARMKHRVSAYDALVEWLKENGPSFEEAEADVARWATWPSWDMKKCAELRAAERAAIRAREGAEVVPDPP